MGRLGGDKQLVHHSQFRAGKKIQIDTQAHQREQVHRFLGGNAMGVCQHTVSAANMVENDLGLLFEQGSAGVFLVFNELGEDFVQPFDNIGFDFAQRHLVRNLEDVAERLGAFAIKTADR